jgi:hypothetical protein
MAMWAGKYKEVSTLQDFPNPSDHTFKGTTKRLDQIQVRVRDFTSPSSMPTGQTSSHPPQFNGASGLHWMRRSGTSSPAGTTQPSSPPLTSTYTTGTSFTGV